MRVLNAVDDDSDRRRTVNDEADKEQLEVVGREEHSADGQMFAGTWSVDGQAARRGSSQGGVSVSPTVAQVRYELLRAICHIDVAVARGTGAPGWRHWWSNDSWTHTNTK